MKYTVIMNVNLEYTFDVNNEEEALEKAMDVELPDSYVDESYELVKVINEKGEVV